VELAAAEALLEVGRAEDARRRVVAALGEDPGNPEALCLLARCHIKLDDQAAALDAATAAVAADPTRAQAHILRGSALVALGRAPEALAAAETAIELAPDRPAAHLVRALALFNTFRRKAAWAALHEVTRLAPHWAEAYAIQGSLHHTMHNYRRARRSYKQALALNPDHTDAIEGLGHLALRSGKLGAAVRQFGAAAALSPTGATAAAGVDRALAGLYGWGFLAAWFALVPLAVAGQYPAAWAIAGGVLAAYAVGLLLFWRRVPVRLRTAARARLATDPRQRVRIAMTALTVAGAVLVGGYEALRPPRSGDGERLLFGLLGSIGWLFVAVLSIVIVDVRQARRAAAATPSDPDSAAAGLSPDQQSNVQIGRLTLRWFRTTALLAIVPSVMAAPPAQPVGSRALAGTVVIVALAGYYVWTVRRWRREPGRPLSVGVAHVLPVFYFGLSALWLSTLAAAYWPGQPPGAVLVGFLLGILVIVFHAGWLPVRAARWLHARARKRPSG
jgi:tetratricopeptide (TPR) repeat protein